MDQGPGSGKTNRVDANAPITAPTSPRGLFRAIGALVLLILLLCLVNFLRSRGTVEEGSIVSPEDSFDGGPAPSGVADDEPSGVSEDADSDEHADPEMRKLLEKH